MGAFFSKVFGALAGPLINAFYGIFKKEQAERKAEKGDALEKVVDSVNDSLEVEKDIRKKQDDVDKPENKPDVVVKPDETGNKEEVGGLNFDEFNKGK